MKEDIENLKWHMQHLSTTDKKGNKVFTSDAYSKVMELVEILNKHFVSNNEVAVCMCEDDWNANDIELTCKHCKKPIEFKQTDC